MSNLTERNTELLAERAAAMWGQGGNFISFCKTFIKLNIAFINYFIILGCGDGDNVEMSGMVRGYIKEIEELRARLLETDSMYQQLKKQSIQQQKARNRLGTYICK